MTYKWEGPVGSIGSQIARGVMPPVAEYVARIVKESISNKEKPVEATYDCRLQKATRTGEFNLTHEDIFKINA